MRLPRAVRGRVRSIALPVGRVGLGQHRRDQLDHLLARQHADELVALARHRHRLVAVHQLRQHLVQAGGGRHRGQVLDEARHIARALVHRLLRGGGHQHARQALAIEHRSVLVAQRLHAVQRMRRPRAHRQGQARRVDRVRRVEHLGAVDVLQERLHVFGGGIEQDVFRRAFLHQLAVLQDRNAVAQAQRLVQVVRDEHDGLVQLGLQLQQVVLHLAADQRVQGREGFVHQQDLGVGGQRPRQPHALLHPARQLVGILVLEAGQAYLVEPMAGPLFALCARHALHRQPVAGVVQHRAVGEQAKALEDHAHLLLAERLQVALVQADHIHAIDQDMAGAGLDQAVEVADERRLARPRQPHDHVDAAFLDGQADVAQAQRVAAFGQQVFLADAVAGGLQPLAGMRAEDLVDILDFDFAHRWPPVRTRCPYDCVMRSNSTASTTMPSPASSPRPTSRRLMPSSTS
ncbi:Uncharacterised protein [Bordetella pertussis]|nr:Uncharacterised protein [Bordetella pertussis]